MQKIHILLIIILCFSIKQGYATDIYVPGGPYSINCVDFDLDGDIDIVVGCNSSNGDTIAILLNDSFGNFEAIYHPKTNNFFYTKCGDINGDSLPDIVTIGDNSDYGYYTNLGNGLIGDWIYIFTAEAEKLAELTDFDNNGFNDLLYYQNLSIGKWGIVYNYGNDSFANQVIFTCNENITSVCSGYLNEDSLKDILMVTPDISINSKVFYNDGIGFIQSEEDIPRSLQGFISDLNNNYVYDIALNHISVVSILILLENIGNDNYIIKDTVLLPGESVIFGFSDVNNDNYPDIIHRAAIPALGLDTIYISLNDHQWGFYPPDKYHIGTSCVPVIVSYADLNGDSYIDLVLSGYLPGNLIKILWNDGTGHFVLNNPVIIKERQKQSITSLKAYPNPFDNKLNISIISENNNIVNLKILDITGREVCKPTVRILTKGENTFGVNLSELSKGIYFYSISIDNTMIDIGKIIKN